MSRPPVDLPRPLLAGDATDFERRILESARAKKPSSASSSRMARTLGVTLTTAGTVAAGKTLAAEANGLAAKATATTGATTLWVSAGLLGVVVAGAVVGTQRWRESRPAPVAPPPAVAQAEIETPRERATNEAPGPSVTAEGSVDPGRARERTGSAPAAEALRDQILAIDAARRAASAGSDARTLRIVRRYLERYVDGSFRPEAAALEIEALVRLGREMEARGLAERFVTDHRGTLLAIRVGKLFNLPAR